MQTEWLYSFVETVRMKSLSKAGEQLNISQTALSKQIKNLEDNFGVALFNRSTSGMELTDEGGLLYERVQLWLKELEDMKRQLANVKSTNHVVIGCLSSIAAHYLPSKVMRVKSEGIKVDICVLPSSEDVWNAFTSGEVDVAIVDRVINVPKIYPAADLFTEPYYAVFPQSHPMSQLPSVELKSIIEENFVLHPAKCDLRKKLLEARVDLTIAEEIAFDDTIMGFVAAGAGITLIAEIEARHLAQGNVVAVPVTGLNVMRTICWVAKSTEQFQTLKRYLR